MDTKMKVLTALLIALMAGGTLMMVQAQAEDANVPSTVPQQAKPLYRHVMAGRWWFAKMLIGNSEPTTISGVVVTYDEGLLVLDDGLMVVVPGRWIQSGSVVAREDLLASLVGHSVTIKALKLEYTNKYTASVYFAYRVEDASALLPWNIAPKTTQ